MRNRHKQPTFVSMWMLDVFCCALGCVILLLFLRMIEANNAAEEASSFRSELTDTKTALLDSEARNQSLGIEINEKNRRLALVQRERDDLAKNLALVQSERDENAKNLAVVRTQKDDLAKQLAVIEKALKTAEAELALTRTKVDETAKSLALAKQRDTVNAQDLAKKIAELAELARKLDTLRKTQEALQQLVLDKEKLRTDAIRQASDLNERLLSAESKLKNSEKQMDDLRTKSTDVAKLQKRINELERQVADASVTIVDLQGTKAKLADKVNQLQIESEQRFAGIAMTGRNVVFLVDMSGSMDRTDENTINPNKWPIVRETLVKVMRTLPDLEQFQVILFSGKVNYLMGQKGEWFKNEKEKSIEQVRKAMAAVKPDGETNLHLALEESFKFRTKGLDTIYLFSDGLPTSGPGLTAVEEKNLTETERGFALSRYLRRTLRTSWNAPDARRQRVRIHSIGFFYESPNVGAFLWALSRENDGSFVGMSKP